MPRVLLYLTSLILVSCAAAPPVTTPHHGVAVAGLEPVESASSTPYNDDAIRAAAEARHARPVAPTEPIETLFDGSASSELFVASTPPSPSPPLDVVEAKAEESVATLPFVPAQLAADLEAIASSAADPVPAHFARALLPILLNALDATTIDVDDFDSRTDLTESERQLLHETAAFSARANERLGDGEAARVVLEEELARLLDAIREPEPFGITFATLIDEVRGVGDFTSRASSRFLKGVNHDARIYMDFEGVGWTYDGTNWSTELELQIQVLKASGYQVYSTNWEQIRDTRARRVAVFAWSSVPLADDLEIGKYVIKVRARQGDSEGFTEHLLPFEIVSRLAGATSRE